MAARKQSSRDKSSSTHIERNTSESQGKRFRLWGFAASLLGALLVWSLLAPQDSTSVFTGSAQPQNLLALGMAVAVGLAVVKEGQGYAFSKSSWITVGGCLLWIGVVTLMAGRDNNPRPAWNGFWHVVALGGCYFAARGLIAGPQTKRSVVLILLAGCVALACQGLHQVWAVFPADRAAYLADPDALIAQIPGLDAPPGSVARQRFEDRLLHSSEPYGTFALANSLAVVLSGGLVLLLGLGCEGLLWARGTHASGSTINGPRGRAASGDTAIRASRAIVFACVASVLLVCWFLTRSRVAYPALLLGGVYWVIASRLRAAELRRLLLWGGGVSGLGLVIGAIWLIRNDSLVLSEAPKSLSYRLEYWLATLAMLGDHWLFGIGLGNFQSYYPIYKLPLASETIADPHNWLLDIAVNLSLPLGLVITVWLVRLLWPRNSPHPVPASSTHGSVTEAVADARDDACGRGLLWGAGVGGGFSAALLGLLQGMDLWPLVLSWLPATAAVWWVRPLLTSPEARVQVTARAAAVTMLTCLLVSGSWQASGIAVPLLLLLLLGDQRLAQMKGDDMPMPNPANRQRWSVVVLPACGFSLFLLQSWQPSTASWSLMQQAVVAPSSLTRLELATAAAAADPLDSEPLRWQVELLTAEATQAPQLLFAEAAQRAMAAIEAWLAMDSVKSLNWEAAGKHTLDLAARAQYLGLNGEKYISQAQRYYSQALLRYPSNIGLRAQLAATLALTGQWSEADAQLSLAEQLNAQTPHLDKQLQSQRLWMPLLPEGAEEEFAGEQPWIAAEPLVVWLRKTISANR